MPRTKGLGHSLRTASTRSRTTFNRFRGEPPYSSVRRFVFWAAISGISGRSFQTDTSRRSPWATGKKRASSHGWDSLNQRMYRVTDEGCEAPRVQLGALEAGQPCQPCSAHEAGCDTLDIAYRHRARHLERDSFHELSEPARRVCGYSHGARAQGRLPRPPACTADGLSPCMDELQDTHARIKRHTSCQCGPWS